VAQVDPEDFYKTEFRALVRFVLRSAGSTDVYEAYDAVQDAVALALPRWDSIRHPRAWLRKVALREFLRSEVPDPIDAIPESAGPDSTTEATEQRRQEARVRATLQHLPFKQRQALAWAYDGFTPAEIAEAAARGLAKLFPASIGGPSYVRSLLTVLPEARIVPTGGIRLADVSAYLDAGAFAVGVGSELTAAGEARERARALLAEVAR
jgi:DNA-directed RNA polymerase specialized sigma24 family protein